MAQPKQDLTGMMFGRLTVIKLGEKRHRWFWWVRCECGEEYQISSSHIKTAKMCYKCNTNEAPVRNKQHGQSKNKGKRTREYEAWLEMRRSCSNPTYRGYNSAGALGISVCEEWQDFEQFFQDMGQKPSKKHKLFRVDGTKNYMPGNCIWKMTEYEDDNIRRIVSNLRGRLCNALKGSKKHGSAVRDLGCSIEELKQHLERQFYSHPDTGEMMTWENYGKYGWHIDHIIPLVSFNLGNRDQLLKACHYTNLQPLWAIDNLKKGGRSYS